MRTALPRLRVPDLATLCHCNLATRTPTASASLPVRVKILPRCANPEHKTCAPWAPSSFCPLFTFSIQHSTFSKSRCGDRLRPSSQKKAANPTCTQPPKSPTSPGIREVRRLGVTQNESRTHSTGQPHNRGYCPRKRPFNQPHAGKWTYLRHFNWVTFGRGQQARSSRSIIGSTVRSPPWGR